MFRVLFQALSCMGVMLAAGACGPSAKQEPSAELAEPKVTAAPVSAEPAAREADANGPSCEACRERHCTAYQRTDTNILAGCLRAADPKHVASPLPDHVARCSAVVECAKKHACAYDKLQGPVHCYCGSNELDTCLTAGPATDAPCVKQWQAATNSTDNKTVLERFSDLAYPSGWGFYLLECDRDYCGETSRYGRCTP